MLVQISTNTMVEHTAVSAIEQIDGNIWVHINGRVLIAEGFPHKLVSLMKNEERKPDYWAGR